MISCLQNFGVLYEILDVRLLRGGGVTVTRITHGSDLYLFFSTYILNGIWNPYSGDKHIPNDIPRSATLALYL